MFGGKGKGREKLYYYLHDNLRPDCCVRDLGMYIKVAEDICDGFEQVDEHVVVRVNTRGLDLLVNIGVKGNAIWKGERHMRQVG